MNLLFKTISALTLLFSSHFAAAGMMGPVESHDIAENFYIEAIAGWDSSDWTHSLNYICPSQTAFQVSRLNNGFAAGGNAGYILNHYFSLEVSALSLPTVHYNIQSATDTYSASDSGSISNWYIDLAGKVTFPVLAVSHLDAFGKFGVVSRAGNFSDHEVFNGVYNPLIQSSVFNTLEPIVGGGLQYHLSRNWAINAQYLFIPYGILATTVLGPNQADHISIPSAQIVTGGIGFYF